MFRSKLLRLTCIIYAKLGIKFSNQYFLGVTNSSINNNLVLPFWMKTKCMKNYLFAYVYQEYPKK